MFVESLKYLFYLVIIARFVVNVCHLSLTGAIDGADDAYSSGTPGHATNDTA